MRIAKLLGISVFSLILGCQDVPEQPVKKLDTVQATLTIPIFYTGEARRFTDAAALSFNGQGISVSDGSVVRLEPLQAVHEEMNRFLSSQVGTPFLWLAQSTTQVESVRKNRPELLAGNVSCVSLFYTSIAFVQRTVDHIPIGAENPAMDALILLEGSQESPQPDVRFVVGLPERSVSGSEALGFLVSIAADASYGELRRELIDEKRDRIRAILHRVNHLFATDQMMLEWLSSREIGQPAFGITTMQQLRSFERGHPEAKLRSITLEPSPFDLDYPLCIIEPSEKSKPLHQQAARLVRGFLSSQMVGTLAEDQGFSTRRPSRSPQEQIDPSILNQLTKMRSELSRKGSVTFVLDSSSGIEPLTLKLISEEIGRLGSPQGDLPASTSVLSCSSNPEFVIRDSWLTDPLNAALSKLTPAGNFPLKECLLTAFEADRPSRQDAERKIVIVITNGGQSVSMSKLNELRQHLPHTLARRHAILYVIAVGDSSTVRPEIAQVTRELGGLFIQSSQKEIPEVLALLKAELS